MNQTEVKKELLAPCGLYCGVCGVLIADRDNNQKFKERLSTVYGVPPEEIRCQGCLAEKETVFLYCQSCPIKSCVSERGFEACHECNEFPCHHVENFPLPVGKKVIQRAIPQWREWGTQKWVQAEESRYICPHCGYKLFRGTKRCRNCSEEVDVD